MKYCFISTFFTGATLPLVKHLSERQHFVDFFLFAHQGQTGLETLIFDKVIRGKEINEISKTNRIYNYLDISVNLYLIPYYYIIKDNYIDACVSLLKNQWIVWKTIRRIKQKKYDIIYIIVNEKLDFLLCKWLKKVGFKNIVIAYHEVIQGHTESQKLKDVVRNTLHLGCPIVTYSEHTKATLLKFTTISNILVIYFGPFETYKLFNTDQRLIQDDYVLFIGHIVPYKGLSFLYETIEEYGIRAHCKVVIAGSGYDPVLDKIKTDERFILINRYLGDSEFANLVRYAKCVVCPYIAGSQSGITHVAMNFGTPIIATKVAAFNEFIEEGKNGFLVDYGNKKQLALAIDKTINSQTDFSFIPTHLTWNSIIDKLERITRDFNSKS